MTETIAITTDDNLQLSGKIWLPESKPVAVICLVHGFGEHIERYNHVAAAFTQENMALVGLDLRGHGKSTGKRGHTPSYDHLLQDLQLLINYVNARFPGVSLGLYGHSMGGNIVINYLLKNKPDGIKAVVVTSPWLRLKFDPPKIKVALGGFMRKIYPQYSEANGLNPDHLSTDKSVGKAYVADPLVNDKITTEMFFAITEAGEYALEHAAPIPAPILVMHGSADLITSPEASREFANKINAEYKLWEGMYHETHNENGKDEVIQAIVQWFKKHTA